jgi:hypothetical protein
MWQKLFDLVVNLVLPQEVDFYWSLLWVLEGRKIVRFLGELLLVQLFGAFGCKGMQGF